MALTVFHVSLLLVGGLMATVGAADKLEELRYNAPVQIKEGAYVQPLVQPLPEGAYVGPPLVQPAPHVIVVDDRTRNQVTPTSTDGHARIGNTICVNRDEYEEFMGWKYGRNQGGGNGGNGANGEGGNRGNYRRNGGYGRGYRRGRY